MKPLFFFLISVLLVACGPASAPLSDTDNTGTDTVKRDTFSQQESTWKGDSLPKITGDPAVVEVDDPSLYSIKFLEEIARSPGVKKIRLRGDLVIFDSGDTAIIPSVLPLNQKEFFSGRSGDTVFNLTVE